MAEFTFTLHGVTVTATEGKRENPGQAEIRSQAERMMQRHGLSDWTLEFNQAVRRAGVCYYDRHVIGLSEPLMTRWTPGQRADIILHEIAHAIAGYEAHHGPRWQSVCARIGGDPTRTWGHNGEEQVPPKYRGTCPNGHVAYRWRLAKSTVQRGSCGQCSAYFDPRFLLTWTRI